MKQSHLFTKTRKEAPKDETSKNAELLIRAGYIYKEIAGAYALLPLGLQTLERINTVIREEMNAIGGQELFLTALQEQELWEKTGRWDDAVVDNWFKTKLKNGAELGLGFTHEEPLTRLMKEHIDSYRDLPIAAYQIQTKFRNELRAKSGIMRGREFLMKDMYSFSRTEEEHDSFYVEAKKAYTRIFKRLGIGDATYLTFASGGTFSKYSHEFQTVTESGEDTIHICEDCHVAVNEEIIKDQPTCPECDAEKLTAKKAVEVGNIFSLGTKFSEALSLTYKDEKGEEIPVVMGSYGIGPGRAMGTIVEVLSDEQGIVWPEEVAPFTVHLVELMSDNAEVRTQAEKLYETLTAKGIEVFYDDRNMRPGEKFAEADLLGMPYRIVVSEKSLEAGGYEVKGRSESKENSRILTEADICALLDRI